ncbi:uncharacterized protein LOC136043222 [Artemia franciscana]|uniref:HopJ type III effector protein n=1 Tax=Artemia franciscana TaxID=6661 RepID=A0AA88KTQ1_ARTSF|nr:hypothetical protein QYM36_019584 [Artemia franciscana]
MQLETLLDTLKHAPNSVEFDNVMTVIAENFTYTPSRFSNGLGDNKVVNEAGTNEGSCKIFAFAKQQGLSEAHTLACFGHYYRDDVLAHPDNTDHANIRQFMQTGWAGIAFDQVALQAK